MSEDIGVIYDSIIQMVASRQFKRVITLNPHMVVGTQRNLVLKEWVASANMIIADGKGISLGAKIVNKDSIKTVTGMDLVLYLLKHSALSFYMIGGEEAVIKKAVSVVKNNYPNSKVVGHHHGYLDPYEKERLCKDVGEKKPDIILVGMGFPLQEYFIQSLMRYCNQGVAIGVGGVFDVLSGKKRLAPTWVRKSGLEWVYRGLQDPKKMLTWHFIPVFLWVCLTALFQKDK